MKINNQKLKFTVLFGGMMAVFGIILFYNFNQLPSRAENQNIGNINTAPEVLQGPRIKVTPESYDLGIVKYEEGASYTFKVQNEGDEPLEILRLSTSCGCTTAKMSEDEKIIPPGESADLLVNFDPSVHQDDSDLGEILRVVYIKSNDLQNPEVEVEIKANVIK